MNGYYIFVRDVQQQKKLKEEKRLPRELIDFEKKVENLKRLMKFPESVNFRNNFAGKVKEIEKTVPRMVELEISFARHNKVKTQQLFDPKDMETYLRDNLTHCSDTTTM